MFILMMNLISINKINHINDFKWNNRVLVIIENENINFSMKIDSYKEDFEERDFIIVYINGRNAFIENRKMSKKFSKSVLKKIKNINSSHCCFLIGKDSQIKNSYTSKIKIERIFSDVDKMPMRKYEIQIRNEN